MGGGMGGVLCGLQDYKRDIMYSQCSYPLVLLQEENASKSGSLTFSRVTCCANTNYNVIFLGLVVFSFLHH